MNRRLAVRAAIAAACVLSFSVPAPAAPAADPRIDRRVNQLMAILPSRSRTRWPAEAAALAARHGLVASLAWEMKSLDEYCVVLDLPGGGDPELITRRVGRDPHVVLAQPVQRFRVLGNPDGPDAPKAAYDDPYANLQTAVGSLRLAEVHRRATGKGVRIGIVDTGIDIDHPELRGRVKGVGNFVLDGEASFTRDVHGTAVAGVIAAAANNGVGVVGVAPEAEIVALKACWYERGSSDATCDSYTLAKAVDAALREKVAILNLSLTGPPDPLLSRLLSKALAAGITVVAAADPAVAGGGFPASLEGVLAVRAAGANERLEQGGGESAFVAAPGSNVLSTAPAGAYDFFDGSSFAAAHAAGVAALLLEARPELRPREIAALLRPYPGAGGDGGSATLDPCAALQELLGAPVCLGG